jgi:hypothetical protein
MIDLVAEFVRVVHDDPELSAALGTRVYGFRIPEDADPPADTPLALVTPFQVVPAARPTSEWWNGLLSIDFHSEDPATSLRLADRMMKLAPTIVGVRSTCVVSDCQVESRQPIVDDGWTPTRFRQVVTVNLTAREP